MARGFIAGQPLSQHTTMQFTKRHSTSIRYYKDGSLSKLHREDGPAWVEDNGTVAWFFNGSPHRCDGPAVEWSRGRNEWWQHGEFKRENNLPVIDDPIKGQWHMIKGILTKTK